MMEMTRSLSKASCLLPGATLQIQATKNTHLGAEVCDDGDDPVPEAGNGAPQWQSSYEGQGINVPSDVVQ